MCSYFLIIDLKVSVNLKISNSAFSFEHCMEHYAKCYILHVYLMFFSFFTMGLKVSLKLNFFTRIIATHFSNLFCI